MGFLDGLTGNAGSPPSTNKSAPISIICKSASSSSAAVSGLSIPIPAPPALALGVNGILSGANGIRTFESYSFERNLMAPGSPFRFTAPGLDQAIRMKIRSGDTIQLLATDNTGAQVPVSTGFIDETDCHISAGRVEYVITGRDTLGQLIDNAAVDAHNKLINLENQTLQSIVTLLVQNTRAPQATISQETDNGPLLFQTIPGETKMNAFQRYAELTNSLIWTMPNGQIKFGKPNFLATPTNGTLTVGSTGTPTSLLPTSAGPKSQATNVLDCRVRRNTNNAIRQIVNQMQILSKTDAGVYTINNQDTDVAAVAASGVGRSVYRIFSFGEGANASNFLVHIPKIPGVPNQLGAAYSVREIARENVQVLDLEITVQGHVNSKGQIYDVDQIYYCNIPDEKIAQNMYVYSVTHELTLDHGMMTKLRLCKPGAIVASAWQMPALSNAL